MVRGGKDDKGRGRGGNNGGYRNGGNGRNWNGNNGGHNGSFNGGHNGGNNISNNRGNHNGSNRGNHNGNNRGNHNGISRGNHNGNNKVNIRSNNKGNHNAGNGNINKNRIRKGNNNSNRDNGMSSHRPPWADYVLKLLRADTFDYATFRSLISAAAVMLALVWEQRLRRGMTDTEIARELQLPIYACEQLKNLSQRAIEGTNQGLDAEGDVPMLDHEQSEKANLVVPELFVWDLFAQNFMNDDQKPPQPTNDN